MNQLKCCPSLAELPTPSSGKAGWPWTEEAPHLPATMPDDSPWPRISIVTPSYNQSRYVEETIRAVLLQGYPNLEYIVVDGNSTDGSQEIIRKYAPWLSYWVSEPDGGQSDAINKGFARATGEIITFLSSDDTYAPGTLANIASRFDAHPSAGALIGAFQFQDEVSQIISEPVPPILKHPTPLDMTLLPPHEYRLHQVSTFYRRSALEKVGFWVRNDLRYVMDRDLLYRVAHSFPLILTNCVYGRFRKHPQSKSKHDILPFAEEFASLYLEARNGHPQQDRLRTRHARVFQASGWLKFAKARPQPYIAIPALFRAIALRPKFLIKYSYWVAWKRLFVH